MLVWHLQYSAIRLTFTLLLTERFGIKNCGKLGLLMRVRLLGICGGKVYVLLFLCFSMSAVTLPLAQPFWYLFQSAVLVDQWPRGSDNREPIKKPYCDSPNKERHHQIRKPCISL